MKPRPMRPEDKIEFYKADSLLHFVHEMFRTDTKQQIPQIVGNCKKKKNPKCLKFAAQIK